MRVWINASALSDWPCSSMKRKIFAIFVQLSALSLQSDRLCHGKFFFSIFVLIVWKCYFSQSSSPTAKAKISEKSFGENHHNDGRLRTSLSPAFTSIKTSNTRVWNVFYLNGPNFHIVLIKRKRFIPQTWLYPPRGKSLFAGEGSNLLSSHVCFPIF